MRQAVNQSNKRKTKEENAAENNFCRNAICGYIDSELDFYHEQAPLLTKQFIYRGRTPTGHLPKNLLLKIRIKR